MDDIRKNEKQWTIIYRVGGIALFIAFALTVLDIILGSMSSTGGAVESRSAEQLFEIMRTQPLLGLYYLDFLNVISSLFLILGYFAIYGLHRDQHQPFGLGIFLICFLGTVVFLSTNSALSLLALAQKYASADTDALRTMFLAAGEGLIARTEHGTYGVFLGFFLSSAGSILLSWLMCKGKIFPRSIALCGLIGNSILLVYLFLVTFFPGVKTVAMYLAAPGGIVALVWMFGAALRTLKISFQKMS